MRKKFNAQKYNERMDKIFERYVELRRKREKLDPIKSLILDLEIWELNELSEFVNHCLEHETRKDKNV